MKNRREIRDDQNRGILRSSHFPKIEQAIIDAICDDKEFVIVDNFTKADIEFLNKRFYKTEKVTSMMGKESLKISWNEKV